MRSTEATENNLAKKEVKPFRDAVLDFRCLASVSKRR